MELKLVENKRGETEALLNIRCVITKSGSIVFGKTCIDDFL